MRSMRCRRRSAIRWSSAAAARNALCVAACALLCAGDAAARGGGADGDFARRESSHFLLLQDVDIDETGGLRGSRRFEQQVLDSLERGYDDLDRWFALRPNRKIDVVIYDPGIFDAQFAGLFRFPAAGFYHGVIRVRGETRLSDALSRVLHHELMHAALDAAAPSLLLPGWVNEGSAEWFALREAGQRGLSAGQSGALAGLARGGELHSLDALAVPAFGGMGPRGAQIAYLQSQALIDFLVRHGGERKLADFIAEPLRSRNPDRALPRTYRFDAPGLARPFLGGWRSGGAPWRAPSLRSGGICSRRKTASERFRRIGGTRAVSMESRRPRASRCPAGEDSSRTRTASTLASSTSRRARRS